MVFLLKLLDRASTRRHDKTRGLEMVWWNHDAGYCDAENFVTMNEMQFPLS